MYSRHQHVEVDYACSVTLNSRDGGKYSGCSPSCLQHMNYEGSSENNASYFILLAHEVRGGCWWYGSRDRTFPPIVFKFCCRATDSSRVAARQNGVLHGRAYESRAASLNSSMRKNWTYSHSTTLAERLRRPNAGCELYEAVGCLFQ